MYINYNFKTTYTAIFYFFEESVYLIIWVYFDMPMGRARVPGGPFIHLGGPHFNPIPYNLRVSLQPDYMVWC